MNTPNTAVTLPNSVRAKRIEAGLLAVDLARHLKVSRATISELELRRNRAIGLDHWFALSDLLGTDLRELMRPSTLECPDISLPPAGANMSDALQAMARPNGERPAVNPRIKPVRLARKKALQSAEN